MEFRLLLADIKALHVPMIPRGVRFVVEIATDVQRLLCLDSLRIHQLISNGLTNAIKVTIGGFHLLCPNLSGFTVSFMKITAHDSR